MLGDRPISEEELHAYVDGLIEPVRRLDVAVYLAHHAPEAARTEAFRAQSDGLHALFDDVIDEALPKRLRQVVAHHAASAAWRRRCAWGLATIAMATLLLLGGRALSEITPFGFDPGALIRGWAAERQPMGSEYPVMRSPVPKEKPNRLIGI